MESKDSMIMENIKKNQIRTKISKDTYKIEK
jgi:hypothetical protein